MSSHSYSSLSSHAQMSSDLDVYADEHLPGTEQPPDRVHTLPTFKLVGDNLDKSVRPRDMRTTARPKQFTIVHMYAVSVRSYQ